MGRTRGKGRRVTGSAPDAATFSLQETLSAGSVDSQSQTRGRARVGKVKDLARSSRKVTGFVSNAGTINTHATQNVECVVRRSPPVRMVHPGSAQEQNPFGDKRDCS